VVELRASHGTLTDIEIDLFRGRRRVAHHHLKRLAHAERKIVLRVHGKAPKSGRYQLVVRSHGKRKLRRTLRVH
jgi:hypothetical protein